MRQNLQAQFNFQKVFENVFQQQLLVDLKQLIGPQAVANLYVRIVGTATIVGANPPGTATGQDNPEALLQQVNLTTTPALPTSNGQVPINRVSQRGVRIFSDRNRGFASKLAPITDVAGAKAIDVWYELPFKRNHVIQPGEYDLTLGSYQQALLTLNMGNYASLFTGTNTLDTTGLQIQIWADIDDSRGSNYVPDLVHAVSWFENIYPVSASGKLVINNLPTGVRFSDLLFLTEEANVLSAGIVTNFEIYSGSERWFYPGQANAAFINEILGYRHSRWITDPAFAPAGIYAFDSRDGRFSKSLDAMNTPLIVNLDVLAGAATQVRLVGHAIIPGGVAINKQAKPSPKR